MPKSPPTFRPPGWRPPERVKADADKGRGSARQRGYTSKWEKARAAFLHAHPLCCYCHREGKVTEAKVVDHNPPHLGDMAKFWDRSTWFPSCAPCHNSGAQRRDNRLRKGNSP